MPGANQANIRKPAIGLVFYSQYLNQLRFPGLRQPQNQNCSHKEQYSSKPKDQSNNTLTQSSIINQKKRNKRPKNEVG